MFFYVNLTEKLHIYEDTTICTNEWKTDTIVIPVIMKTKQIKTGSNIVIWFECTKWTVLVSRAVLINEFATNMLFVSIYKGRSINVNGVHNPNIDKMCTTNWLLLSLIHISRLLHRPQNVDVCSRKAIRTWHLPPPHCSYCKKCFIFDGPMFLPEKQS